MLLFTKIYVINLVRRSDRKEALLKEFKKLNLPSEISVTFITAVDGEELPAKIDTEGNINYRVIPDFLDPSSGRTQTKGEIGCALSHHKTWERAYKELGDKESCLILEDDVYFQPNFWSKVEEISKEAQKIKYDLLYLGRIKVNKAARERTLGMDLLEPSYSYWCSSIVYTKRGLEKILSHDYLHRITPADEFIPALMNAGQPHVINSLKKAPDLTGVTVRHNLINQRYEQFHQSDTELSPPFLGNIINPDEFKVLTVGTDYNDGLRRLETSLRRFGYAYEILGLGQPWYGGDDILNHPGAGQKVNILRTKLKEIVEAGINPLILFLDGYDTIVLKASSIIREEYELMGHKILFGAEKTCWPDPKLAPKYPKTSSEWKYLNSGQFIGYAKDLLNLIEDGIEDAGDDQYYYSEKFLEGKHGIGLDYNCQIFQCSLSDVDLEVDISYASLKNIKTGSYPIVAHGNGGADSKYYFNYICNFVSGNFRESYGYLHFNEKVEVDVWNTRILISVFDTSKNPEHIYSCLDALRFLEYPKECLAISIYSYDNSRKKGIVRYLAQGDFTDYESIFIIQNDLKNKVNDDRWLRTKNLKLAEDFDYNLCIDSTFYLDKKDIITELIAHGKTIIGPLTSKSANFWLRVNKAGWQMNTEYDNSIIKNQFKGVWAVAYLDTCYLIDCKEIEHLKDFFNESFNIERGTGMAFCYNLVAKGYVPYMVNINEGYGEIQ